MRKMIFIFIILFSISCCKTNNKAVKSSDMMGVTNDTVAHEEVSYEGDYMTAIEPIMLEEEEIEYEEEISEPIVESVPISSHVENKSNNAYGEFKSGTLAFKLDSVFIIGVTSRVEARIIKSVDSTKVTTMIEMFQHTTNGHVRKRVIPVGNIMDMKIYSFDNDAFDIQEMTSENQLLEEGVIAHWIWSVKPLMVGEQQLIIKAIIKRNSANIERIVYDETIDVVNKPKKDYMLSLVLDSVFIKDEVSTIKMNIEECGMCLEPIKWGNNGIIVLEIDDEDKFEITNSDNVFIDKFYQEYKWKIKPSEKGKYNYKIVLKNDNERLILRKGIIVVKGSFMNLIDRMLDFWEFLLTFLIIPIIAWIRNKKKNKEDN